MGGHHKKNKASSSSSNRGRSSHNNRKHLPNKHRAEDQLDHSLEEEIISSGTCRNITWKDFLLFLTLLLAMTAASVGTGLVAGMTVSIHFYQEQTTGMPQLQRVTTLDHDIRAHNTVLRTTGRVAASHDSEVDDTLVVQELPPLNQEMNDFSKTNQTQQGIVLSEVTVLPTLCPDGETIGFQDWNTLKAAIREANALSAEKFLRWNEYFSQRDGNVRFDDVSLYYEQDVFFTICPGVTLKARRGPIFINAENIVLECRDCTIDVGGSHLAFGPHAKNVLVRGVTFRGAHASSLTFYHHGSEASFEDCQWYGNAGNGKSGAVADVNSTSSVSFYRCEIDDAHNTAYSYTQMNKNGLASSLSIRA